MVVSMTKDEALKLALEALKQIDEAMPFPVAKLAQKVIKEVLAQPEQPKVRTGNCLRVGVCASEGHKIAPQRKPLTDKEIDVLWFKAKDKDNSIIKHFARAIEAAHGIKGEA
jgi:hypothetical protein